VGQCIRSVSDGREKWRGSKCDLMSVDAGNDECVNAIFIESCAQEGDTKALFFIRHRGRFGDENSEIGELKFRLEIVLGKSKALKEINMKKDDNEVLEGHLVTVFTKTLTNVFSRHRCVEKMSHPGRPWMSCLWMSGRVVQVVHG
jgi:hypothetical protein